MRNLRSSLLVLAMLALVAIAPAAIPSKTAEELQKHAEHIVTGKVQAVYTRETKSEQWRRLAGVVEITVNAVEKGDSIKQGDIVYVRFWRTAWIGEGNPPTYGTGHVVPEEGAGIRAFLTHKEGVLQPLLPNGLVPLKAQP